MTSFGNNLKKIREEKGLSVRKAAKESGISHPYLSQLENNIRKIPSPDMLRKLAKGLNTNYVELLQLANYNDSQVEKILKDTEDILKNTQWEDVTDTFMNDIVPLHTLLKDDDKQIQYNKHAFSKSDRDELVKFIENFIMNGDEN